MFEAFIITLIFLTIAGLIVFEETRKFRKDVSTVKSTITEKKFNEMTITKRNASKTIDLFVFLKSRRLNKAQLLLLAAEGQTNKDVALFLSTNTKMGEIADTVSPVVFNIDTPYDILVEAYQKGDNSVVEYIIRNREVDVETLYEIYKRNPELVYDIFRKTDVSKNADMITFFKLNNTLTETILSNPTADVKTLIKLLMFDEEYVRVVIEKMLKQKTIVSNKLLAAIAYSFPSLKKPALNLLAEKEDIDLGEVDNKALSLVYM
jgi:hypothetical protein